MSPVWVIELCWFPYELGVGENFPPTRKHLFNLFLACSIALTFWECLQEIRGRRKDHISVVWENIPESNLMSALILCNKLWSLVWPKSLAPQWISKYLGGSSKVAKYLTFLTRCMNFRPPYPCHQISTPLWFRPKLHPPGLFLAAIDAFFMIDEPTIQTVILSVFTQPVMHTKNWENLRYRRCWSKWWSNISLKSSGLPSASHFNLFIWKPLVCCNCCSPYPKRMRLVIFLIQANSHNNSI